MSHSTKLKTTKHFSITNLITNFKPSRHHGASLLFSHENSGNFATGQNRWWIIRRKTASWVTAKVSKRKGLLRGKVCIGKRYQNVMTRWEFQKNNCTIVHLLVTNFRAETLYALPLPYLRFFHETWFPDCQAFSLITLLRFSTKQTNHFAYFYSFLWRGFRY